MKNMSNTERTQGVKKWFKSSQALLSMLLVQIFATGLQLLSRIILVEGTYIFALTAYRHIVAAICVAPFAFYFERLLFILLYFLVLYLICKLFHNLILLISYISKFSIFMFIQL
jgi:hypothetical protein